MFCCLCALCVLLAMNIIGKSAEYKFCLPLQTGPLCIDCSASSAGHWVEESKAASSNTIYIKGVSLCAECKKTRQGNGSVFGVDIASS